MVPAFPLMGPFFRQSRPMIALVVQNSPMVWGDREGSSSADLQESVRRYIRISEVPHRMICMSLRSIEGRFQTVGPMYWTGKTKGFEVTMTCTSGPAVGNSPQLEELSQLQARALL